MTLHHWKNYWKLGSFFGRLDVTGHEMMMVWIPLLFLLASSKLPPFRSHLSINFEHLGNEDNNEDTLLFLEETLKGIILISPIFITLPLLPDFSTLPKVQERNCVRSHSPLAELFIAFVVLRESFERSKGTS
jgi:hypothetical protein